MVNGKYDNIVNFIISNTIMKVYFFVIRIKLLLLVFIVIN